MAVSVGTSQPTSRDPFWYPVPNGPPPHVTLATFVQFSRRLTLSQTNRNPKFDAYLAASEDFAKPIMMHLRSLLHTTCPEVVEELKWGIPHFDYKGEMMCIFAASKKHCSFGFWKDALMADPRLKANSSLPAIKRFMGKLTKIEDLPTDVELIGFIREAMTLNENGVKLPPREAKTPKTLAMPPGFAEKLAENPTAKQEYDSKSDSFRKDYLVWITDAKTDATRQKRIEESVAWIAEGKGRFWKYEK
jgi:uncharacterized protein YdeI (YjbR/CyaY-like superfamily)